MKQGIRIFMLILSVCAVSTALAKQPQCVGPKDPPGQANKPTKVTILHCGCADEGNRMHYVEINVSSKSRGHLKHEAGSIESCPDDLGFYKDFVRSGSDCQLVEDGDEPINSMLICELQIATDECGTVVTD